MKLSPCWEAASRSAAQEFSNILWIPKVHYRVRKSPPLVHILSQFNPVIPPHPISILIFFHLRLGLPSGLFPSGFATKILYALLLSPYTCYIPCPSHHPWLEHSNYILATSTSYEAPHYAVFFNLYHFIPLRSKYSCLLPSVSVLPLMVRDQVSHPYKTTGKMYVT
jgi:hypothetical protein